jgi:hypothetical protein
MSNRFDFLKPQPSGDDDQSSQGDRPSPQPQPPKPSQGVTIPGLEPKSDEGVVLERLNVEIPADLHQQLKQYCTNTKQTKKKVITALIEFLLANQ